MIVIAAPADLTSRVGEHLGWSGWYTVTQAEIDHFAKGSGNRAAVHTDPEWAAANGPYGGTIAFGIRVLAMATMLLSELWELRVTGGFDAGSNRVRHLAPVTAGGRVRLGAVLAAAASPGNGAAKPSDPNLELRAGG